MVLLFLLTLDSRKERPWNQNACARKGRGLLGWALTSVDVTLILWKEIFILFGMEGMQLKVIEIDAMSPCFSFPLIVSLVWWDYPFSITSFSSQSLIFKWYVSVICKVPKCRKGNLFIRSVWLFFPELDFWATLYMGIVFVRWELTALVCTEPASDWP